MPDIKRPRRGSLAFYPRKRAFRIYPQLTTYPEEEKPRVLAFAGYKVGMLHAILLDTRKGSATAGQEIAAPITVLDCPPIKILAIRTYENTVQGLKIFAEVWARELPKDLERKVKVKVKNTEEKLKSIENNLNKISRIRLIVSTQPRLSGVRKKTPEVFEIEVGGKDVKEKFDFCKNLLGKEIKAADVFKEGEIIDVIAVTKGKGTAGVVKRFGVKIQSRHAKKKRRHIGSLGQERPGKVRPATVPMAGQLGFQTRTELNKRILKIGEKGEEITPKSGFVRYGIVKNNYILIEGSTPGSKKRLIMIRPTIRPRKVKILVPEIKNIVKE